MPRTTLLLFTASYPYSVAAENTFLPQEIESLRPYFERIVVVPAAAGGARDEIASANVEVDSSYARYTGSKPRLAAFAFTAVVDPAVWRELFSHWRTFLQSGNALLRMVHQSAIARLTERWVMAQQQRGRFRREDSLFYTWWFDATTLGAARAGRRAGVPAVTRVHGRDLYEERQQAPYLPFRRESLKLVTRVYSVSSDGMSYLARRYPAFAERITVSRIGIEDPGFLCAPSADGVFRIVSCSLILPVKRVGLLARGIAEAGRLMPQQRLTWTHIGDGPRDTLSELALGIMPPNVTHTLLAYPGKAGLADYYRRNPIDLFMNTSKSEGVPVAIMEAISVGMPVLATAVGGNPEIVGPDNGMLLAPDPEPREIAEAIRVLMADRPRLATLRAGSRAKWGAEYSASRNYPAFAEEIRSL